MALDVQTISGSVAASSTDYVLVGTYTVPAGENRLLLGYLAIGNANDQFKLVFNAGSNKNYPWQGRLDDDPASLGNNAYIKFPRAIDVPANSVVSFYAKNSSGSAVTTSIDLIFEVGD